MEDRSRTDRAHCRVRRFVMICFTLLIAFSGAGCGSDDNGDAVPTATPTVSVPTPTSPPAELPGPGMVGTIDAVNIASDGQIVVTFTLTDAAGVPIIPDLSRVDSEDKARVRFTIAHLEHYPGGGERGIEFTRYVNDVDETRPTYDSGGTLETVDQTAGVHSYTFATVLTGGFDESNTYAVGMQADREFDGVELSANPIFDVVPGGGEPEIRAGASTEQCNTCHDPLRLHGNRREYRLCTLCHTEAAVDEKGRSIDLRVMIHKIHAGVDLPLVADGEPGAFYGIFSSFRQSDVIFSEKLEDGELVGVAFPRPLQDCESCHSGGPTSADYANKAAAAPCTSCHDDVNPSQVETAAGPPGTGHLRNNSFPDGQCALCHDAGGDVEFDITVLGAHTVPERSMQLSGLIAEITGVSNTGAGQAPAVSFKLSENDGTVLRDLGGMDRVAFAVAGPTSEYESLIRATAIGGDASGMLSGPDVDGVFEYTFPAQLPIDADGTWAVGLEARREVLLEAPMDEQIEVEEAAANPVVTFQVGDGEAEVRRMVVDDANCQNCHGEFSRGFSIHGNLRNRVEYCVLCHAPNNTDVGRRNRDPEAVANGDETASIDFKILIHKIHTGEDLAKPYVVYGFGPAPAGFTAHDFSEILYPGDRRNCAACHVEGTQLLPPFPGDALGPIIAHLDPETGEEVIDDRAGPIAAVCTSCHDNDSALAHAQTQTAPDGGEACEVCHSEGRQVAVSEAHARED